MDRRNFGSLLGLVLLSGGCASPPPDQAFDKVANRGVRRIALLIVPETELRVVNLGGAIGAFGLVGGLVADREEDSKSSAFSSRVAGDAMLAKTLTRKLASELEASGYQVSVTDQRPITNAGPDTPKVSEEADYATIETQADAILDVSFLTAGYLSPAGSPNYVPWIHLRARLVSPRGARQLFFQFMVYGAKFPQTAQYFPARPEYAYPSFDALMANHAQAAEGLRAGLDPIAKRIAAQLR